MLNSANLTFNSGVDQDAYIFGSHEKILNVLMHHLQAI